MRLREMWGRLVGTKYTRALESDVARLRVENRALLNSILGIAGVPPIVVVGDDRAVTAEPAANRGPVHRTERGAPNAVPAVRSSALSTKQVGQRATAERGMKTVATPMRRRSWHQIHRMLEIDAARKKEAV
jgi:hypothetical protein